MVAMTSAVSGPPPSRLEDKLPKFPGIQTYPIEHHLSMAVIYRYFSEKKQRYDTHYEQLARQLGVPQPRARRLVREVWSCPRLDALDPSDIIAEVATGRRLQSIADEYLVDVLALRQWLRTHRDELKQAESDAAEAQMELAEEALALTTEKVELGVNSELLNHARWKAERLAKEKFRPTGPVVPPVAPLHMVMVLGPTGPVAPAAVAEVIEHEPDTAFTETQQPASAVPVFLPILDLSGNTAVPQQDSTS